MSNPYDTQVGGDHYSKMKIQPSEFINKNEMLFAEGNAIKYICRHGSKGRLQDLLKAKHYIDMIIERDYGDDAEKSKVFSTTVDIEDNPKINITYENLSISDEEGLPQDKTEDEIFYPSGVSIENEK